MAPNQRASKLLDQSKVCSVKADRRGLYRHGSKSFDVRQGHKGAFDMRYWDATKTSEAQDKARYSVYDFENTPTHVKEWPEQMMTWRCMKCGVEWKTFKEFLYDGCSPVYGNGTERRLNGV